MSNNIDVVQNSVNGGLSLLQDIPKFSGNKIHESTPKEVRIFIRKVEVAAKFSKVDDLASIAYMKLFGAAASFAESDPEIQNAITDGDWAAFKSKLLKVYSPRQVWSKLDRTFSNAKQGEHETCYEFLSRLRTLKDDTLQASLRDDIEGNDSYSRSLDDRVLTRFCEGGRSKEYCCMQSGARDEMTVDELADKVTNFELFTQDEHIPKYG
jgi:Retrotransposon gag protein